MRDGLGFVMAALPGREVLSARLSPPGVPPSGVPLGARAPHLERGFQTAARITGRPPPANAIPESQPPRPDNLQLLDGWSFEPAPGSQRAPQILKRLRLKHHTVTQCSDELGGSRPADRGATTSRHPEPQQALVHDASGTPLLRQRAAKILRGRPHLLVQLRRKSERYLRALRIFLVGHALSQAQRESPRQGMSIAA